ncbi:MAG: hypothetical protein LBE36_02820 [Flavobacteriaceae bacterium]|jgi:uncharacterized membrane-anchored protein YhcB (DUF1043 family)|nr:hypothetical protein [Flavobacteriaceae bacterium]
MNTDKSQDQYDDIFRELKNEKMDWNFEDFLQKTETPKLEPLRQAQGDKSELRITKPCQAERSRSLETRKIFWMAASIILLFGIYFGVKNLGTHNSNTNELITNEINKQKEDFDKENSVAANEADDSLNTVADSISPDSDSVQKHIAEEDILDKIVSKKGRIKKSERKKYVKNETKPKPNPEFQYQDNYVIINGQKITNEQEAINITRYSFQILSEKMGQTIAATFEREERE